VVVTFTDVSDRKKAEVAMADARDLAEGIVETVHEPLVVLNADLRVISANPSFYRLFQAEPGRTVGKSIWEVGNSQWHNDELKSQLEKIVPENVPLINFKLKMEPSNRRLLLNARRMQLHGHGTETILVAINDTGDAVQAS